MFRFSVAGTPWTQTVPHDLVPREDGLTFDLTVTFLGSEDADLLLPDADTEAFRVTEPELLGVQVNTAAPPPPIVLRV
jgi:hypothetical protein